MTCRRYRPRHDRHVAAVRLDLDTNGFTYRKWGHEQRCKAGDWIVDNDGEVYTVDADSFARTYQAVQRGSYVKITPVWAEQAREPGKVKTKEGYTSYKANDWLVSNYEDGSDTYAIGATKFETLYELDE